MITLPIRTRAVALAVLGSLLGGCSVAFTDTVPDGHANMRYFDCTSTSGLAVADGVFALSGVVGAITTLSDSEEEFAAKNDDADRDLAAGANIAAAVLFAASGVYGIIHSQDCSSAKDVLRKRYGAEESEGDGPPPPPVERTRRPLPVESPTPQPAPQPQFVPGPQPAPQPQPVPGPQPAPQPTSAPPVGAPAVPPPAPAPSPGAAPQAGAPAPATTPLP